MKSPVLLVPSLVPLCMALALSAQQPAPAQTQTPAERAAEIQELRVELGKFSARLDELQNEPKPSLPRGMGAENTSSAPSAASVAPTVAFAPPGAEAVPTLTVADKPTLEFFRGTTINVGLDGYYGYNFNEPIGRVNLLRAYDVSSNSLSLNQASLISERLPSSESRYGGRLDLQFGQATETLQGSSVNEQRPQVWRNLFQAYGSYLAPVGSGLEIDFGKFASSLGNEGNYTRDQIAYSRAYSFNYLPFYHMGLHTNYNVTPKVNVAYWLVNGANDTEDLNGFKSQAFLFTLKPASTLT